MSFPRYPSSSYKHQSRCLRIGDDDDDDDNFMEDPSSDTESVVSTAAFSTSARSRTTYTSFDGDDFSMRSPSPVPSVLSMNSVVRDQLYRMEFGRNLNNYSNVYQLPADDEELERLEKQYEMLNELMGGKYAPPMEEIMKEDDPEVRKTVLDLGTGAGNWIIDVARQWPNSDCVAVDLIPMKSLYETIISTGEAQSMPTNLRSEVDDINLGLEHFRGDFDVVHARLISMGVRDYYRLIDQIADVLRPRGLLHLCEVGYLAYDKNHQPVSVDMTKWERPYWPRWLQLVSDVAREKLGGDIQASSRIKEWVNNHPAYEEVVYQEYWMPIIPGRWNRPRREAEFLRRYNASLEYDVVAFLRSGRPMLLAAGYPERFLLNLERLVFEEFHESSEALYSRLECVYARKKAS